MPTLTRPPCEIQLPFTAGTWGATPGASGPRLLHGIDDAAHTPRCRGGNEKQGAEFSHDLPLPLLVDPAPVQPPACGSLSRAGRSPLNRLPRTQHFSWSRAGPATSTWGALSPAWGAGLPPGRQPEHSPTARGSRPGCGAGESPHGEGVPSTAPRALLFPGHVGSASRLPQRTWTFRWLPCGVGGWT